MSPKKKKKPSSLDLVFRKNNIQNRCSLDLVSPNNDTNGVDANKRKVYYKKKRKPILTWPRPNNNCTNPYTFEQNMLRNKTISHKKKTFLMQILTRDSEDTFFSWPIQRTHEAEEEYFSHKKPPHLTWSVQTTNWCWGLGPARAPADQFSELSKKAQVFSDVLWI